MKKYATEYIDDYTHFVVWQTWTGSWSIESGWEYEEDAKDHLDQINDTAYGIPVKVRIMSRKALHRAWKEDNIGILDIYNDDNWNSIPFTK